MCAVQMKCVCMCVVQTNEMCEVQINSESEILSSSDLPMTLQSTTGMETHSEMKGHKEGRKEVL